MCAKYSDFLCIWLRKCDFLSGKVRYWPDPDPKLFIPDPDPAKSSGSTTLIQCRCLPNQPIITVHHQLEFSKQMN